MIKAIYEDGREYTAENVGELDLSQFVVNGLTFLAINDWRWTAGRGETLLYHGLRTSKDLFDRILQRAYVLVTNKAKYFFFQTGGMRALQDWVPGDPWFDVLAPTKMRAQASSS